MRKIATGLVVATLLSSVGLFAQSEGDNFGRRGDRSADSSDQGNSGRKGGRFSPNNNSGATVDMPAEWAKVQTELKKADPEAYKEIEKLQSTNLFLALEKMRELAAKSNITLPNNSRRMRSSFQSGPAGMNGEGRMKRDEQNPMSSRRITTRQSVESDLKAKYPTEYAEIEKLRAQIEDQLQALAKKAGVSLPETMESYQRKMAALKASGQYKTEFEEIDNLQKTNRMQAMMKTMELAKKAGIESPFSSMMGGGMMGGGMMGGGMMGGMMGGQPDDKNGAPREGAGARHSPMQKLNMIRKKYPEEMKKLDGLRSTDPRAYREEMMKLIQKFDAEEAAATPQKQ